MSAVLSLLTVVGCGPVIDPDGAWADLGQGAGAFLAFDDGAVFEVERGAQGGMHIWVSLQTYGIDPGPTEMWQGLVAGSLPIIQFQLASAEGVLTEDLERPYVLERLGDSEYELLDNLVQFDHFPELPEDWQSLDWDQVERDLEEQDLQLSVQIVDAQGTVVEESRSIKIDFPEEVMFGR